MDFEEFKQRLIDWMNERYDAEFECQNVLKNNGIYLTGITGYVQGQNISPNIYIDELYDSVEKGMSFEAAASIVETKYALALQEKIEMETDIFDINIVKHKIVTRIVNFPMNEELLKDIPYKLLAGDLAFTYRLIHSVDSMGIASSLINNQEFEAWNISLDELHSLSMENTERIFPAQIKSMKDVMYEIIRNHVPDQIGEEMRAELEMSGDIDIEMYVISNDTCINGATAVMYPSVQEWITQKFGEAAYILPSSIHETIVVPFTEEGDKEFFNDLVKEANMQAVDLHDKLSDNIYQFRKGELVNVNQFEIDLNRAVEESLKELELPEHDPGIEM